MWAVTTVVAILEKYWQKLPHNALGAALDTPQALWTSKSHQRIVVQIPGLCEVVRLIFVSLSLLHPLGII